MGNHMSLCSHLMMYYHKVSCGRADSLSQCSPHPQPHAVDYGGGVLGMVTGFATQGPVLISESEPWGMGKGGAWP